MAQQPTPNEIQRHAQNVAQMADAAKREAVMREMAERGIHVRSEVNKILAERAAEMPQQPENEPLPPLLTNYPLLTCRPTFPLNTKFYNLTDEKSPVSIWQVTVAS